MYNNKAFRFIILQELYNSTGIVGGIILDLIIQFLDESSRSGYNMDERIIRLDENIEIKSARVQNEKF